MTLLRRCFTGLCFIVLIFSALKWGPKWFFDYGVAVFSALGLYEFLTILRRKGIQVYRVFGVSMGAIIPLVVHFQFGLIEAGEILFLVLGCFCLFVIQFLRKENPKALEGISLTFFGLMYVAWFLSHLIKINWLPNGSWWIMYLLVVTKASDIAAYLLGSKWGKNPLIPHISPNKTVEGTLAGICCSAVVSLFFYDGLPLDFGVIELLVTGAAIGMVAQCGDLSESLIKRYCSVKDSEAYLPGFGGLLDVMDSVLFTAPLFYYYIKTMT